MINILIPLLVLVLLKDTNGEQQCHIREKETGSRIEYYIDYQIKYYGRQQERYVTTYEYSIICRNAYLKIGVPLPLSPDDSEHINEVKYIKFEQTDTPLPTIPVGVLNSYTSIEKLFLNSSNVEVVEPGSLSGLNKLIELYLQDNKISLIHRGTLNGLKNLQILNLSNNNLSIIEDESLKGLFSSREIYLSRNRISFINESAFETLREMEKLDLSHNNISTVSSKLFQNNTGLLTVLLNNNNIQIIPKSLFAIRKEMDNPTNIFTEINLSYNNLSSIAFEDLSGKVFLSHNKLTSISYNGPHITYLDLSFNKLTSIPAMIFKDSSELTTLILDFNNITNIHEDSLKGLNYLTSLFISHNNIHNIPIGTFSDLNSLLTLNLLSNYLEELEYGLFTGLISLKNLILDNNKLISLDVSTLYPLKSLTSLNLNGNLLETFDIPKMISHLKTLKEISVDNNRMNCEWLTDGIHLFEHYNITVQTGFSIKIRNVHGISCISEKKIQTKIIKIATIAPVEAKKSTIFVPTTTTTTSTTPKSTSATTIPKITSTTIPKTTSSNLTTTNLHPVLHKLVSKIKLHLSKTLTTPKEESFEYSDERAELVSGMKTMESLITENDKKINQLLISNSEYLTEHSSLLIFIAVLLMILLFINLLFLYNKYYRKHNRIQNKGNGTDTPSCALELLASTD